MRPGSPTTSSPGGIKDQILKTTVDMLDATTVRLRALCLPDYSNKYYSLFINGIFSGRNVYVDSSGVFEAICPCDPASTSVSAFIEDAGQWAAFEDDFLPSGGAEAEDSLSAQRLQISWTAAYTVTPIRGDSQLSSVSIVGAVRGVNVGQGTLPTRGLLSYTISTASSIHTVSWFADGNLVAAGSRTGNGALVCSPATSLGLTAACSLTYSGDVAADTAFLELRWPASYQLHYSTSSLSYPRSPEATYADRGYDDYTYLTPILAAGTYNWNVLEVDDDGDVQSSGFPVTTPSIIYAPPLPATITSVTGTASALTVHWTAGQAGCTYNVYTNTLGYPVNLGDYSTPSSITTATNATSQTLAAVTGYPGTVRIIVRATASGVQERTDNEYDVELDASGAIVNVRPNRASVRNITITGGRTLNVEGCVLTADAAVQADTLDLYVVALGSPVVLTSPQASVSLPAALNGIQRATASYTVGSDGYYQVVLNARVAATSARSLNYATYVIYVSNVTPPAVSTLAIKTIRGR